MNGLGSAALSRRALIRGLAALPVAGFAAAACDSGTPTAADLLAQNRFLIAHRGSRNEAPEHTMEAYTRIVERGATAVEISVHRTADGVLVCHHDLTLERTCAGDRSAIKDLTFAELSSRRVDLRRSLGPDWGTQAIPRLDAVLDAIGGRAVLFIEPKVGTAVKDLRDLVVARKLQPTTVFKQYYKARQESQARAAGLLVWNYSDTSATTADIVALTDRSDAIGAAVDHEPLDDAQSSRLAVALATGKPVIGTALDRRHQVDDLAAAGVRGFMASSWSYMAGSGAAASRDAFAQGRVQPGDLPGHDDDAASPVWNADGSISLADSSRTQSLSMGSMCPTPAAYDLSLVLRFDGSLPTPNQHAGIVLGPTDDAPYIYHRGAPGTGFLAVLLGDGTLQIRQVADGGKDVVLASTAGPAIVVEQWEHLDVQVRPDAITVVRAGAVPVTASARVTVTGRYFALTRDFAAPGAVVRYRDITVSAA